MDEVLAKLDDLVHGSHFRAVTSEFFIKYCFEFSEDEENRLEYTAIHKEYEALVESQLESLGDDYLYVCEHFADFMANPGELTETRLATLETLTAHLDALGTPPEDVAALVES